METSILNYIHSGCSMKSTDSKISLLVMLDETNYVD